MNANISNYIESVTNSSGRFRTLREIYPVNDSDGNPILRLTSVSVDFEMAAGDGRYIMKCIRSTDDDIKRRIREASVFARLAESPFLSEYIYLEEEMLVFDNFNQPSYADVVMLKRPDGKKLDAFLEVNTAVDHDVAAGLLKGISELGRWMADNKFSHGKMTSATVWIGHSFKPVLIDYSGMERKTPSDDMKSLAVMAVTIYLSACEPGFYDYVGKDIISGKTASTGTLPALAELISGDLPECLKGLAELIEQTTTDELELETLAYSICDEIEVLSDCKPRPVRQISEMLAKLNFKNKTAVNQSSMQERIAKYRFVGELRDMLIRAWDGNLWFYLDKNGQQVITSGFLGATDFWEGRAVVETETGYGMIDRDGNYIISPIQDDIEWDATGNLAIVTKDGMSGLYTREGESITGLIYDQILNISDELIAAKRGKRYGYISRDGNTVIDFIYEDAFGFRDGIARVRYKGREYLIDKEGREIEEIAQPKPVPVI